METKDKKNTHQKGKDTLLATPKHLPPSPQVYITDDVLIASYFLAENEDLPVTKESAPKAFLPNTRKDKKWDQQYPGLF